MDEARFNDPPQKKNPTVGDLMTQENRWLHPDIGPAMYREMKERGEVY
jgi:hypothetical protein